MAKPTVNGIRGIVEIAQVGEPSVHNYLPIYSLEKLCFTVLI